MSGLSGPTVSMLTRSIGNNCDTLYGANCTFNLTFVIIWQHGHCRMYFRTSSLMLGHVVPRLSRSMVRSTPPWPYVLLCTAAILSRLSVSDGAHLGVAAFGGACTFFPAASVAMQILAQGNAARYMVRRLLSMYRSTLVSLSSLFVTYSVESIGRRLCCLHQGYVPRQN